MPTDITPPEFLPIMQRHRTIDNYRDRLRTLYTQPGMQHPELDHWKMAELRIHKIKRGPLNHEYLIATFTDGVEEYFHLCVERQIQNASSPPTGTYNNEQDDTQIVQSGIMVLDHVSLYPDDRLETDITAEHIAFRQGHRISLPEFVLLACAVRECSRTYPLKRANSPWFCFAMMAAMKARCPEHDLRPVQGKKRGTLYLPLVAELCGKINIDELLARAEQMWSQYLRQLQIQANVATQV